MEKHPLHLKNPELQTSPEVQRAVLREEQKTGEKVPNDPAQRIEAYMDRLENIFLNPDERKRERNLEMFRDKIYDALIIKRENFPESYFELQKRIARERGQAVEEIPENVREQMISTAIEDQRASLDAWINYFTSEEAVYPAWFKYFVWKNITKLSQFDKERGEFKKRTDTTVAPFPDIHSEPLARILDLYEQVKADNKKLKDPEIQAMFSKKFPSLYAELTQKSLEKSLESREGIRGEWITYKQGKAEDARRLYDSLQNKGTGWCVAGLSTAQGYIKNGDFHIYYSHDKGGAPTNPRLAIAMNGNRITELRGLLPGQTPEPQLQEVIDGKLKEFGSEADTFRKTSSDMKMMTKLHSRAFRKDSETEQEIYLHPEFSREELVFLYEIDGTIESFGRDRDSRIEQIRSQRDPEADMPIVFDCSKDQIARSVKDLRPDTKAYVGPLEPGIFESLPDSLEHLYTSFPDGKIERYHLTLGEKTVKEYEAELAKEGFKISDYAKDILAKVTASSQPQETELVRLTVKSLGFNETTRYDKICERAGELGLDLSPSEAGPALRLALKDQPMDDWVAVAMELLANRNGNLSAFNVRRSEDGSWLFTGSGYPDNQWDPKDAFAFARRKKQP
ncbi:MAG: hypothetical protein UY77_C0001G0004 [Candidatus Uhrbacteria bacterium GW2011_GWA2_53_10]|uniref:Uncharacterized protein n=1 Tax=Candidatus Uhrbacteria bacterium GW2011_GWA2_53_10 TaxID=1618980 RepID=A0A0G2AL15_9BACT|nr:MAG: hypothetical protein UY77_C0001G0004 [Candidatus Uhrbacteria bacterium GW2011_GWA2_53_10]